jgi:hypothetical protein
MRENMHLRYFSRSGGKFAGVWFFGRFLVFITEKVAKIVSQILDVCEFFQPFICSL